MIFANFGNMENHKELIRQALIRLFEQKGGYKRVAKTTTLKDQRLYYIQTGRNAATDVVIKRIVDCYPDETKELQALTDIRPDKVPNITSITNNADEPDDTKSGEMLIKLEAENKSLKEQLTAQKETLEFLKDMIEELRLEKNALFAQLFPYDPTDPNSNNLGRRTREQLRAGKLWGSDDATDLSVTEIMEREEQKRNLIGFGREKYEAPKKAASFLTVTRGAIVFTSDKFALLAQA